MNKHLRILVITASVSLILLALAAPVNHLSNAGSAVQSADGLPMPPPPGPKLMDPKLVADGLPMPPPPGPKLLDATVAALV